MIVSLIAAVARNLVIGKNNDLPWHLPDDMKYFMKTTWGHYVLMGRKNYQSIPQKFRPLPDRVNLVVTHQQSFEAPGCVIIHRIAEGIDIAQKAGEEELFIIGGAQIFNQSIDKADRLYLTEIDAEVGGDTHFPAIDRNQWEETSRRHHNADERHAFPFDFVVYKRKNAA